MLGNALKKIYIWYKLTYQTYIKFGCKESVALFLQKKVKVKRNFTVILI